MIAFFSEEKKIKSLEGVFYESSFWGGRELTYYIDMIISGACS